MDESDYSSCELLLSLTVKLTGCLTDTKKHLGVIAISGVVSATTGQGDGQPFARMVLNERNTFEGLKNLTHKNVTTNL